MIKRSVAILFGLLQSSAAFAAETTIYSYDALGRLTSSSISGGPSSGVGTGTGLDAAGNRTTYSVTGAVGFLKADKPSTTEVLRRSEPKLLQKSGRL